STATTASRVVGGSKATATTAGASAPSTGTACVVLGRMPTIARSATIRVRTFQVAANTVWKVSTWPSTSSAPAASTTTPAPVAKARRVTISLLTKVETTTSTSAAPTAASSAAATAAAT